MAPKSALYIFRNQFYQEIMAKSIIQYVKALVRCVVPQNIYHSASIQKRFLVGWLQNEVFLSKIRMKWFSDKRRLPLTRIHWEIYLLCHKSMWKDFQRFPNLINPQDFNDHIQWLKIFDQVEEKTRCCDKIRVRDYIRERVGEQYLVELYQTCERFDKIDFDSLPNNFVIKTNHDSGTTILVRNKSTLDMESARKKIDASLSRTYGWEDGEWMYAFVSPKILVEELLDPESDVPPADYRFHCVNGRVRWMQNDIPVPFQKQMKEVTVDPFGSPMKVHFSSHKIYTEEFKKPDQWNEMVALAEVLASGWKYVRVDMFISEDRIFCGELTFTPFRGLYAGEGQKITGKLMDFDRTTFQTPIYHNARLSGSSR